MSLGGAQCSAFLNKLRGDASAASWTTLFQEPRWSQIPHLLQGLGNEKSEAQRTNMICPKSHVKLGTILARTQALVLNPENPSPLLHVQAWDVTRWGHTVRRRHDGV